MRMKKFGPRYGFKKFADGGSTKAKSVNPSANEGIKPLDSPERRKFLAESEAQRRQEAAAAAQRAAEVEARSKAKAAQRAKTEATMKTQADMDRKMQEAYQRFQNSSENDSTGYKRGGSVGRKFAGGGGVPTSGGMYDTPAQYPFPSSGGSGQTTNTNVTVGGQPTPQQPKTGPFDNLGDDQQPQQMRRGGKVKKYARGGSVGSASKRADGCATKGKTRGRFV